MYTTAPVLAQQRTKEFGVFRFAWISCVLCGVAGAVSLLALSSCTESEGGAVGELKIEAFGLSARAPVAARSTDGGTQLSEPIRSIPPGQPFLVGGEIRSTTPIAGSKVIVHVKRMMPNGTLVIEDGQTPRIESADRDGYFVYMTSLRAPDVPSICVLEVRRGSDVIDEATVVVEAAK